MNEVSSMRRAPVTTTIGSPCSFRPLGRSPGAEAAPRLRAQPAGSPAARKRSRATRSLASTSAGPAELRMMSVTSHFAEAVASPPSLSTTMIGRLRSAAAMTVPIRGASERSRHASTTATSADPSAPGISSAVMRSTWWPRYSRDCGASGAVRAAAGQMCRILMLCMPPHRRVCGLRESISRPGTQARRCSANRRPGASRMSGRRFANRRRQGR